MHTKFSMQKTLLLSASTFALIGCTKFFAPQEESSLTTPEMIRTSEKIDIYIPFNDMRDEQKRNSVRGAARIIMEGLNKYSYENPLDPTTVTFEKMSQALNNDTEIDRYVTASNEYIKRYSEKAGMSFNLIPSGLLFVVGGRLSAAAGAGAEGSLMVGAVIVPSVQLSIDRHTRKATTSYSYRTDIVGIPSAAIKLGGGGSMSPIAGLGFIWGDLSGPCSFSGVFGAVAGNVQTGVGIFAMGGLLKGLTNLSQFNPFVIMGANLGAGVEFSPAQAGGGAVVCGTQALQFATEKLGIKPVTTTPAPIVPVATTPAVASK